jgi:hypothetical protein
LTHARPCQTQNPLSGADAHDVADRYRLHAADLFSPDHQFHGGRRHQGQTAPGQGSGPQTEETITVFVDAQGRAFIGEEEISLAHLFDRLKQKIGSGEDELVVVRADRAVILNKAVKVMDIAKAAGAGRLCLATEKEL